MAAGRAATHGDGYAVIEQPELHLHPGLHAPLASFFCALASGEKPPRLIIETHSENFLLGVQIAVASGALRPDNVLIHWIRKSEDASTVQAIRVDSEGRPETWPTGVFDEDAALARELLQKRSKEKGS
jgi:predicted ATPase